VVGYGSAVLVKAEGTQSTDRLFSLAADEKSQLLSLARVSVEYAVRQGKAYEPPPATGDALNQERGTFVTLRESGELRGCVGYTSAAKPLYMAVRDTATLAALRDTRFRPVSASELPRLEYEISVLSPLRRVLDIQQIHIGQDGLLMKNRDFEGVLLPQVPLEAGWDRTRFLEETCIKAGMHPACWKDQSTDIFLFTAVVFGENQPAARPSLSPGPSTRPAAPAAGLPPH
jgi:AmmeMemoRadiSam system protein A